MTTTELDTAPPEMTARWLRIAAGELRLRSMTALPNDDFDLYAIGESLDQLAEQLNQQHADTEAAPYAHPPLPTPAETAQHLAEWAKTPTSFKLAEQEQRRG